MNLYLALSFIFGSCIGSFLNVVILRLPKGESLGGRSHCPVCGRVLSFGDLLPIWSFVFLGGRCRTCKTKISWRYFAIELITGLLFALCWYYVRPENYFSFLLLIKYFLAVVSLIVVFVIDWEHYLILDLVVFPSALAMAGLNILLDISLRQSLLGQHSYFISGLIGAAAAVVPFFLLWYFSSGRALGFGDVKLVVLLGMTLGWPIILVSLMISILLGGVVSTGLLLLTAKTLKSQVPFGTFLAVGSILAIFYGQFLMHWYLSLLGF